MKRNLKLYLGGLFALLASCVTASQIGDVRQAVGDTFEVPSTVDLTFTNGGNRKIYIQDSTTEANGKDLTISAGAATVAPYPGGTLTLTSGKGADATSTLGAGWGGDFRIHGQDAGAARDGSGTAGSHGGNVHIYGGVGTNPMHQHGGLLLGEETTDEIRIGHKPEYGTMNLGHIRHLGYLSDSSSIFPSDVYTLRFELSQTGHLVDVDKQVAGGGAGTYIVHRGGAGGNATSSANAAQGGLWRAQAGNGGDGTSSRAASYGASTQIWGGAAGADNGGGGSVGGPVEIDGGPGSGGQSGGPVYVGNGSNTSVTYIGHDGAPTYLYGITNPTLVSGMGTQTIKVADLSSSGAGTTLKIRAGKGGTGGAGNGGDLAMCAGDYSGGSYGGSNYIEAGAGSSTANAGYLFLGTNAGSCGATAKVQIGDSTQQVALFGSGSFAGGQGVVFVANTACAPTGTPSGGGILYVEGGALKFKGSSGTVTTVAAP